MARMSNLMTGDCGISAITTFELFTGLCKCANPTLELTKLETLLQDVTEQPFDSAPAMEAAKIRVALEAAGQVIGPFDMLIAGHALALNLVLVTNNTKEFVRVSGLSLENWHS
jgi:tRNA(fMet)-specific endonuclease VapC